MSKLDNKFIADFKLSSLTDVDKTSIEEAGNNSIVFFNSVSGKWEAKAEYSHPNHSGEITSVGDGVQTLDKTAITNKPTTEIDNGDFILFSDTSDGGSLKKFDFTFLTTEVYETIWAEENGGLSNNNRQWSFGNGSTGNVNVPAMYDCKIREMGIDAETVGTSVVMQLMINNVAVATASMFGVGVFPLDSEITVNKGDFIGFRTLTEVGNYNDVRVAVALIQEIKGLRGAKGDTGTGGVIIRKDNTVIGTITSELNFEGSAVVSAVDDGGDKTTVTIENTSEFNDGGDSKGTDRSIGNNDNFGLDIKTNNIIRIGITNSGEIVLSGETRIVDGSEGLNKVFSSNATGVGSWTTLTASFISDFDNAVTSSTHANATNNPHSVTKAQVGLGNVDDTSDVDKPVSIAQAQAISDAISNLIDGAPVTLDTLNELAQAINDDANFATTITTQLSNHISDSTNPHNVTKAQVGLGNADNTSDINKPVSTAQQNALDLKYNASNPSGFETPAQLNARDVVNRARANHTGTQLSNTISNFASTVRATLLTGLSLAVGTAVTATDSILVAIGKLQTQITLMVFGDEFQFAESLGTSTTTSGNYIQKLRLTTTNLPAGNYIINWSADGGAGDNDSGIYQVEENDTTQLTETEARMNMPSGVVWYNSFSGHAIRTLSGVNTFDIDFRESGGTASIRNARLTLWRVV